MFNKGGLILLILALLCAGFFCFGNDCSAADHIIISELQITGGAGKTKNDFIELYNPTGDSINLKGYRLVKRTKTGNADTLIKSWTSDALIFAHGYYLWANSADDFANNLNADVFTSQTIANDNGVALRFGKTDEGEIIDSVCWGNCENVFIEGTVFSINPGAGQSMERELNIDTDNNSVDFFIQDTPTPHNSSMEPEFEPEESVCGDGNKDEGEECDDGNNMDDDGCSADCLIETSESGTAASSTDDNQTEETASSQPSNSLANKLGYVVINELVSDPADGEVEWIELYNTTSFKIDLDGWSVTEGSGAVTNLAGTLEGIGEEKFFVIEKPKGNLNNSGDIVFLRDSANKLIDQAAYGDWDDGYLDNNAPRAGDPNSIARKLDGLNSFNNANDFALTTTPTKGGSNIITSDDDDPLEGAGDEIAAYDYSNDIIISEVFPNPVGSDSEAEFVELYNQGDRGVDLTGWQLGDASKKRYEFGKEGAIIIKAEEYLVIYRSESKIALNNTSETIKLFKPLADEPGQAIAYEKAVEGWSYNLTPAAKADWVWSELITPGAMNEIKTVNHPPVVDFYCPLEAGAGESLEFDCSDTVDEDGDELTFAWDFGDNFTNNLAVVEHTYLEPGVYTISLSVSDGENLVKSEKIIKIKDPASLDEDGKEIDSQGDLAPDSGFGEIIINEFLPNPDGPDADGEWVEIFNRGEAPINLIGWQLDDCEQGSRPYLFAGELWLAAGAYLVIEREESGLALNNTSDAVRIFNSANSLIDEVAYSKVIVNQAYARNPAQAGQWVWTTVHTPGLSNIIALADNSLEEESTAQAAGKADKKTATAEIITTSLEEIRNLELGNMVKVCGTVAVLPGILGSQYFYIVGSPGIQIYNYNKNFPDLALGDYIEVAGELAQSSGERRVKTKQADDIIVLEQKELPLPEIYSCAAVSEEITGRLITVTGEVVHKSGATVYLDDDTREVKVFIKQATGISLSNIKTGDIITVTGIVNLTKSGARILPRFPEDIVRAEQTSEQEAGQVLGASAGSDAWTLPQRDKKLELFRYLLVLSGAGLMIFLILLIRVNRAR